MQLYLRLAWRNVWRHRRRTLIVVLAIGISMAMMMWYDGFVAGFEEAIYANAIKVLGGNVQIHAQGYQSKADKSPLLPLPDEQAAVQAALAQPQVAGAARRINTSGMATNASGAFPVSIVGIEPDAELPVNLVMQNVKDGRFLSADDRDVLFVGQGLADAMDLKVGDRITLVGRATHEQMRQRTMTVVGIYDVGMPSIEKRTVYMSLLEAQDLYGLTNQSSEIVIYLKQLGEEPQVMNALRPLLPGTEMGSWQTNFPEMTQALQTKGGVMDIFSVIILVIAGIGVLNLLLMAVFERTREIGLLGALGLKPRQISWLFLLEGAMMGVLGAAFGVVLGLIINISLGQIGFDFAQFASLTEYTALISGRVYPTLGVNKLGMRIATVLVITLLASYYPAREASLNEPAEALHYV